MSEHKHTRQKGTLRGETMPIYAQALTCRKGYQQITQVAVTRAESEDIAQTEGLAAVIANFPAAEGFAGHACACKKVSVMLILKETAKLLGIDYEEIAREIDANT